MTIEIRAGTRVRFLDGIDATEGVVNGAPIVTCAPGGGGATVHIPVHVHATNSNLLVDSANITHAVNETGA